MKTPHRITGALRRAATATALAAALATQAPAADLVYGSWLPEAEYTNRVAMPRAFAEIAAETGGEIVWRLVPGGQLVNPVDTFDAIESGLVQGGMGIPIYVPSLLPAVNVIYQTVRLGNETGAAGGAALETLLLDCPQCTAELRAINAVPLAGWATSPYHLGCTTPVRSVADMRGLKIRATGGNVRLMEAAGAVPVAATLVEAVSLLQTGAIDCIFGVAGWYRSFGYADFITHHTDYPMGMTGPATGWLMNAAAWGRLTEAQKDLHLRKGAMVSAMSAIGQFTIGEREALQWAQAEKGVTVVTADAAGFDALMQDFEARQRVAVLDAARSMNVSDPEAILAAYDVNFARWQGLTAGIGEDVDALAQLYYDEVFSRIDTSAP